MTAHSAVGASSSKRWMNCPGSVAAAAAAPPSSDTVYSAKGTCAHALGELCLRSGIEPEEFLGKRMAHAGFEFIVDSDMVYAVGCYVRYVNTILGLAERKGQLWYQLEYRVNLSPVICREGAFGTLDCGIAAGDTLWVLDYKNGRGVVVDVTANTQLMYYGAYPAWRLGNRIKRVILGVIQPRAEHADGRQVHTWEISRDELLEWARGPLATAIDRTREPNAPRCAGEWCRFCPALPTCPEALERAQREAALDFLPSTVDAAVAEVEQKSALLRKDESEKLSRILRAKPFIENFLKSVETEVGRRISVGIEVPGYKWIRGGSNRAWIDPSRAKRTLDAWGLTQEEFMTEPKLVTPAQAERQLLKLKGSRKGATKKVMQKLTEKPPGRPKLVTSETPGKPLSPNDPPDVPKGEFPAVC